MKIVFFFHLVQPKYGCKCNKTTRQWRALSITEFFKRRHRCRVRVSAGDQIG